MTVDDIISKGAILQRDGETYGIVPRIPCGVLSPDILEKISRVVKKFKIPTIKIISGERLALIGIKRDDLVLVWEELGMDMAHATGLCFHYVQACPGTDFCKYGIQDSIGLGGELEKVFYGRKFPAKVKIGVSGCNMCCANSFVKDIGIVGKRLGWTLVLGGRAGTNPRGGEILEKNLSKDDLLSLLERFLDYYNKNAAKDVRVWRFVERVGIEKLKTILMDQKMMNIKQVPYSKDNFAYVIYANKEAIAVDPGCPDKIVDFLEDHGLTLTQIVNTHAHHDHVEGNAELERKAGLKAVSNDVLVDRGYVMVGGFRVDVIPTPGHTIDSVCFKSDSFVVTGDTLFIADVGKCSESMLPVFRKSLDKLLALPDNLIVYPGHDYIERSLKRAEKLGPYHENIINFRKDYNPPPVCSTIGDEKKINPYFRDFSNLQ